MANRLILRIFSGIAAGISWDEYDKAYGRNIEYGASRIDTFQTLSKQKEDTNALCLDS
jgi:hypothetical protein